jgi:hypothetical protein
MVRWPTLSFSLQIIVNKLVNFISMNDIDLLQLIKLHAENNGKSVLTKGDTVVYMAGHATSCGKSLQEFKDYISIWYSFQHDIGEEFPSGTCHYVVTGVREVLD